MKAKMPPNEKPPESGVYECIWCDHSFTYEGGEFKCPNCGGNDRRDLIPIYMENNPADQTMYTSVDFMGG